MTLKKYTKYKPSGVEWIGDMPTHWASKKIKRLSPVKRGASPRPIDDPKYFDDNGVYHWVRIADVTASDRYLASTEQKLSDLGASLSVKRHPGDFFLSIAGTVGKPIITKIPCCIHDGFVWFPELRINPEFLYYVFTTGLPYKGLGKWGTQLNLNTETVGDIVMPIPPDKELEKIISYLDEKTALIDSTIRKKEKLIELLQEERTAVINRAVTHGLDPNVKLKDSGVEWLGEIPEHWKTKRLKFLAQITTGNKNTEDRVDEGEYPFFVRSQTVERINSFTFEGEGILTAGDGVGVGKVFHYVDGKFDFHQRVYLLYAFKEVNGKLLFNFIKENLFKEVLKWNAKSTVDSLRLPMFQNFVVAYPPSDKEQSQIVKFIEDQERKGIDAIQKITEEVSLLKEYRTALINEVVTGKRCVVPQS